MQTNQELHNLFNKYLFDKNTFLRDLEDDVSNLFEAQKAEFKAVLEGINLQKKTDYPPRENVNDMSEWFRVDGYNQAVDELNQKIIKAIEEL